MISVSVLGCGWLGFSLAQALLNEGYFVKGSTTTLEKIPVLKKAGIFSLYLQVNGVVVGEGVEDFFKSQIVIITLPFRRDFLDPRDYQKQIRAIIFECEKSAQVKRVIFTSSTSVYPDQIGTALEDVAFSPDDNRGKVLREIEKELLGNTHFSSTIVRFAGLYGPKRKIGGFLAGKKELSGGNNRVNLIHRDDAVGIIAAIIRQGVGGEIFNGCSDIHPTRNELYTAAAKAMGLTVPEFCDEAETVSKIVSNEKVKKILGYKFIHPDPLQDVASPCEESRRDDVAI
ncbi:MAG: SDR family oxidoreductase [Candidatus Omnitrophica bacterium]|nr:SDR family oxidoreductase [Candidatus Omnitrophota bacterium]